MTAEDFFQYIRQSRNKATYKEYKNGVNKFAEWFEKTPSEILEMGHEDWINGDTPKKKFGRELEKFRARLNELFMEL